MHNAIPIFLLIGGHQLLKSRQHSVMFVKLLDFRHQASILFRSSQSATLVTVRQTVVFVTEADFGTKSPLWNCYTLKNWKI